MGKVYDILLDQNTGENEVRNGDDYVGESTRQHSQLLIICEKGENKMEPDSGVGVESWILDEGGLRDLKKETQAELEADGQTIDFLIISGLNDFKVAGKYGN
ncbi:hypothetical protein [Aurantibacillus circumpalustris]|uniref:hypothetical protein n=1 Tax=Aurantibacillus circumpalustris TaxID=3036359 RepID=UPI00295BD17B|nr:hypothetical protein [Aurantibacillus circumpalustris]